MGYAALGVGLPLAAAHLDDLYNQQTPPANTYKWRLVLSYDGTRFSGFHPPFSNSLITVMISPV